MKFKPATSMPDGVSLQGYTEQRTYAQMTDVFGSHHSAGDGEKVSTLWELEFEDGTYASIYDYKMTNLYDPAYPTPENFRKGEYAWHVGGVSPKALVHVAALIEAHRKARIAERPPETDLTGVIGELQAALRESLGLPPDTKISIVGLGKVPPLEVVSKLLNKMTDAQRTDFLRRVRIDIENANGERETLKEGGESAFKGDGGDVEPPEFKLYADKMTEYMEALHGFFKQWTAEHLPGLDDDAVITWHAIASSAYIDHATRNAAAGIMRKAFSGNFGDVGKHIVEGKKSFMENVEYSLDFDMRALMREMVKQKMSTLTDLPKKS